MQHYDIFSSGRTFNNHKQFTERSWTLLTKFLRSFLLPHSCLTSSLPHCKNVFDISDPVFIAVEILFDKLAMNLVTYTQYQPTPLSVGDDSFQSQIFKTGDQEKNECLEGLKEFLYRSVPRLTLYYKSLLIEGLTKNSFNEKFLDQN